MLSPPVTARPGIEYLGADTAYGQGQARLPITEVHSLMLDCEALSQGAICDSDS